MQKDTNQTNNSDNSLSELSIQVGKLAYQFENFLEYQKEERERVKEERKSHREEISQVRSELKNLHIKQAETSAVVIGVAESQKAARKVVASVVTAVSLAAIFGGLAFKLTGGS